jgi:hypothetical protein
VLNAGREYWTAPVQQQQGLLTTKLGDSLVSPLVLHQAMVCLWTSIGRGPGITIVIIATNLVTSQSFAGHLRR